MKNLLKILTGGFLVFMVLAVAQEWDFFSSAWFGEAAAEESLSEEQQQEAVDTVRLVLTLMRHFYSSGGDSRFAERLPVAEGVLEEMRADIEYLARNHRRQEPVLLRFEVLGVELLNQDRVEVTTREFWRLDLRWVTGEAGTEPPRSQIVFGRYLLSQGPQGWRLEGWGFLEP